MRSQKHATGNPQYPFHKHLWWQKGNIIFNLSAILHLSFSSLPFWPATNICIKYFCCPLSITKKHFYSQKNSFLVCAHEPHGLMATIAIAMKRRTGLSLFSNKQHTFFHLQKLKATISLNPQNISQN